MQESNTNLSLEWAGVCNQIKEKSGDVVLNRWLDQMIPERTADGGVCLCVPTRFIHEWMKEKAHDVLISSLWNNQKIHLKIMAHTVAADVPEEVSEAVAEAPVSAPVSENTYWDPSFTFDNFVTGPSNDFAVAAAKRVAESNSVSFNPLYLHSSVGLGKTHLMHAIAQHIQKTEQNRRVMYLSAEKFMYQFVSSLRADGMDSFRTLLRGVDVLMIDDIQFLCGKGKTQEEFFHTFNTLVEQGKQIVLSSDSSPLDLKGIEDRLRTRMASGLVVDIYPTTYEMRIGILQTKAALLGASLPADVAAFLAERITTNVRELEGALKRVVANAQLLGSAITLANTKMILRDLLAMYEKEITVADIQKAVADYYTMRLADLKSTRKDRSIARPRQMAMYLAKTLTTKSLPDIGRAFDRDHTTILHAVKTIEGLKSTDATLAEDLNRLSKGLKPC